MATTAAHAGTGALLREEQDQFLQREYFALLISEAACCHCFSLKLCESPPHPPPWSGVYKASGVWHPQRADRGIQIREFKTDMGL